MNCRGPMNPLVMLRARGLSGPFFQNVGGGRCVHTAGNYLTIADQITLIGQFLVPDPDHVMTGVLLGEGDLTVSRAATVDVPDGEGTDQTFGTDEAAWAGGRVTGAVGSRVVYDTDSEGVEYADPPWLAVTAGDSHTLDSANLSQYQGALYAEVYMAGDDNIINGFLYRSSGDLTLDDGTTQVTAAMSTNEWHEVGVAWSTLDGKMDLFFDGSWVGEVVYDGSLLSGDLDLFRDAANGGRMRNLRIYSDGSVSPGVTPVFDWLASTGSLDAAMSIARAGTGLARDASGYWISTASNTACFDHTDASTQFLLIEPTATNALWYSNDLTQGEWATYASATVTRNQIGLTGAANTGNLVTDSNASGTLGITKTTEQRIAPSLTSVVFRLTKRAATSYTALVVHFRDSTGTPAGTRTQVPIAFHQQTGDWGYAVNVGQNASYKEVTVIDEGIRWAVVVSCNDPLSSQRTGVAIYPAACTTSTGAYDATLLGSCIVENVDVYDDMTHANAVKRSAIITPTTAAVSRAADTLSISGLPASNETRITFSDDSTTDLDDWNGSRAPTGSERVKQITVYNPGERPV